MYIYSEFAYENKIKKETCKRKVIRRNIPNILVKKETSQPPLEIQMVSRSINCEANSIPDWE